MTVKQLMRKLKSMPEDAKVIFCITHAINEGAYEVDGVEDWKDGTVYLDSEHKKNYWEDRK